MLWESWQRKEGNAKFEGGELVYLTYYKYLEDSKLNLSYGESVNEY